MTLAEWAQGWPYTVQQHPNGGLWMPDSHIKADPSYRALAWSLSDYRVSSVSGGSIWFIPRDWNGDKHVQLWRQYVAST